MASSEATVNLTTAAKLKVLETLGEGGYALVYKAEHVDWGPVAFKKLPVKFINDVIGDRLKKEAAIQNQLRHPNIVMLLAMVFEPDNYGLVLEYMKFGELETFLETNTVDCTKKLSLIRDAALGMSYLHSQTPPVIHGDLKIQNVLVNEDQRAKISDFGFSQWKSFSRSKSREHVRLGTVSHVAPENLEDPKLRKSEPFDVYGFGILMWEILTQERPYPECMYTFV
jgi:serine/threonine protein kinase